jgi:ribonuclease HII
MDISGNLKDISLDNKNIINKNEKAGHQLFPPRRDCIEFGIDEVGRGCLFGPVCVCCVYIPNNISIPMDIKLRDSKKTTSRQRKKIMEFVDTHPDIIYRVVMLDNNEIDKLNILRATFKAMHKAIDNMPLIPEHLCVDGHMFDIYMGRDGNFVPHNCIKKGDDIYQHISLAANIAKFKRDEYIVKLCEQNPWLNETYALSGNKGYGSKIHMDAIKSVGITEFHRKSFKPCSTARKHRLYGTIKNITERSNLFQN